MRRKIAEIFLRIHVDKVEKIDKVETQIANEEEKVAVFMKTASTGKLLAFIAIVGVAFNAQAQETIYSNETDPLGDLAFEPLEFGDEVAFGDGWEENFILSGIALEYHTSEVAGSMVIRIRQNNGPAVPGLAFTYQPGTILYESVSIPLGHSFDLGNPDVLSTGAGTLLIEGDDIASAILPNRVTLTVEFRDLNEGQTVGIITRNPPTIGQSSNDIWVSRQDDEGNVSWSLAENAGTGNFALEIVAVPEPSAILLSILGGAAFFLLRRRK